MFDFKNLNIRLISVNLVLLLSGLLLSDPFHFFDTSYDKAPRLLKLGSKSDISIIRIINDKSSSIELKKSDSGWSVKRSDQEKDYPADNGKIEAALDRLLEMRKYNDVSSHSEKYEEFEVSEKGLLLELEGDNKVSSIYIGKQGGSYNTSLIRLKDDKTVYSVRGNLKSDWNQNLDYFRIKQLFHLAKENLQGVNISGPTQFELKNSDNNLWILQQGGISIDTNEVRVNRLLDDLSLLEGTEFYYLPFTGFPYGNVKVLLKTNTTINLEINRIGNEFIARTEQNPYWQKIPEYRIKSIFPGINEIKASTANEKKQ